MKNKLLVAASLVVSLALLVSYYQLSKPAPNSPPAEDSRRLKINTSFYPLYFFTTQIAGQDAAVRNITPAGAEPHDYELTGQDISAIESGQLLIINGHLEPWARKVQDDLISRGQALLVITDGLDLRDYLDEDGNLSKDPHIWLDPQLAITIVDKILNSLSQLDPLHKENYNARASVLKQKLADLHGQFKSVLANCEQTSFITSHTAFYYLGAEYGLKQIGISGLSPDIEPTPKEMLSITKFAKQNNVKYIFFESLVSPKLAQTIAKEVGATTLVLNPLEGIPQSDIDAGKDYFSEMSSNLSNLRIALQCQ